MTDKMLRAIAGLSIIGAVCILIAGFGIAIGGGEYFRQKGMAEAVTELARHGASAAAIDCIIHRPAPIQWSAVERCQKVLEAAK